MTKLKERIDYQERLNRVIVFIHDHLDEEIDLNRLADVACLSPYHWHRIYHAMHGETIAASAGVRGVPQQSARHGASEFADGYLQPLK